MNTENRGYIPNLLDRTIDRGETGKKKTSPVFSKMKYGNPILWVDSEFDKFVTHHREDREREDRNHRFFTALDYAQWSPELLEAVRNGDETRDLSQYNILHKKINGMYGVLTKNPTDIDFVPVDIQVADSNKLMKRLMMRDKETMSWTSEMNRCYKDGLIYGSFVRMTISDKLSPLGNIGIEHIKPGKLITSPYWKSDTMVDCPAAFTVTYLTGHEAVDRYPKMKDIIDSRIRELALGDTSYTQNDTSHALNEFELNSLYDDKYRFLEYHHMSVDKTTKLVGTLPDGSYVDVPEPPTRLKDESQVNSWLDMWYEINGVDKEAVIRIDSTVDVYYVYTTCSELSPDKPFVDEKSNTQLGRLPFFNFSYERHEGRNMGLIDLLADPQATFNKRMSMISSVLGHQAKGGYFFDPEAVDNDERKIQEIKKNGSKPGFIMDTAPGYLANGTGAIIKEMPTTGQQANNNLGSNATQMLEMLSQLTPHNTAMEGISESNRETGRLFNFKREQGEINMAAIYENMAVFKKEIGEAYFNLSQALYSGITRKLVVSETETITLNEPATNEYGEPYVKNDISTIPRQSVVISQAASGITQRTNDITMGLEMVRIMPPEAGLTKLSVMKKIVLSLDNYSEKERDEMNENMSLEIATMASGLNAQKAQNDATAMQAQMATQQMMAPPPQQPPEGEGMPPEGMPQEGMPPEMMEQLANAGEAGGSGGEQMPTRDSEQITTQ